MPWWLFLLSRAELKWTLQPGDDVLLGCGLFGRARDYGFMLILWNAGLLDVRVVILTGPGLRMPLFLQE